MKLVPIDGSQPFEIPHGCERSSGDRWPGILLREVVCPDWGELPEGYFVDHVLTLQTTWASTNEVYFPGRGWSTVKRIPGSVHFLPMGIPFATAWSGRIEAILLTLSDSLVLSVRGDSQRMLELRPHLSSDDRLLGEMLLALTTDLREGSPFGTLYGEQLAAAMVSHMLRHWGTGCVDRQVSRTFASRRKFDRIADYIHAHIDSNLSISSLASIADLGVDQFIRSFKRSMGTTPHQYVLRCRIARAEALLCKTRASVKRVAYQCGFPNESHFIKAFRRGVGITPAEFRDQRSS